jgi:hypothetical protein
VWKWTQEDNSIFVFCSNVSIHIGLDNGKVGLCINENLDRGRSEPCRTFRNEPLTPTVDFQESIS